VIVAKRVELSSTEIKEGLTIYINNVVALALLEINEVKDLYIIRLINSFTFDDSW
jgi:hypothetical protein